MAYLFACELPDHLWYHIENDVWVQPVAPGLLRLGMTDPAQTRAGKILHFSTRPWKTVKAGKTIATIESGKWLGPVLAPMPGQVVEENQVVRRKPDRINRDPYGDGWLVLFETDVTPDAWAPFGVLTGKEAWSAYRAKLERERTTCVRCQEPREGGPTTDEAVWGSD
ncbi:MAG: glycine cleavage system protein H [Thermaerobacter sp.]|nr:glycine cleavage system protein H [Thermaerobacter sp.]